MAYELYRHEGRWRDQTPRISITRFGHFYFNAAAKRKLQAAKVHKVQLLWDKDEKRIAMRPMKNGAEHCREIHFKKKGSGFAAKAFLAHIGFKNGQTAIGLPFTWNGKLIEFSVQGKA